MLPGVLELAGSVTTRQLPDAPSQAGATLSGMRRTLTAIASVLLVAGCSSSTTAPAAAPPAGSTAPSASTPKKVVAPITAAQAVDAITKTVTTAKAGAEVTAADDGNHLLGRPGQYTSKVGFTDSRVKPTDVEGMDEGDVARGGAVEVFANADDAKTRAAYIQAVTKSLPAAAEYDYTHGPVLIRVSKFLTPDQAAAYDKVGAALG